MALPFIVVHFKTIPPRIAFLQHTIQSWLMQSVRVDQIVISVRETYRHFGKLDTSMLTIYKKLSDRISIQVLEGEEKYGPNDKIIGALTYANKRPMYIIICDDDLFYHEDTVKSYMNDIKSLPSTILTHYAVKGERLPRIQHIQGADTYLLPPCFFEKVNVSDYIDFLDKSAKACPEIFYQDDYMISFYAKMVCHIDIKIVSKPLLFRPVHFIEELHQHPLVHQRERNTITYLLGLYK